MLNRTQLIKLFKTHKRLAVVIGALLILGAAVLLSIFMVSSDSPQELQPVPVDKSQVIISDTAPYQPDVMIVRYHLGKSPYELKKKVDERAEKRSSFFGKLGVSMEDSGFERNSQRLPEDEYEELMGLFAQAGVVSQEKMYDSEVPALKEYYLVQFRENTSLKEAQQILQSTNLIDFAQPSYTVFSFLTPNDPQYPSQWGMQRIQMPQAWDMNTGSGITVAVVDSGIEYTNSDLRNVINGSDFTSCAVFNSANQCVQQKARDDDSMDEHGHGTHVAGIIGAATNNGHAVAGINWNVQMLAVKIMNQQGLSQGADTVEGIQYAAAYSGVKVINMSLGSYVPCSTSPSYQDVVNFARSRGIVMVAAAGNDGLDTAGVSPASCPGVIAVGATDQSDARSVWGSRSSNWGSPIDLSAPGTEILSTYIPNRTQLSNGTSMATPHVAGAAALLLSANPSLSPDQVEQCLVNNADPIQTDRPIGGRRLNVFRTLQACRNLAGSTSTPTPTVTVTPSITDVPTPSGGEDCINSNDETCIPTADPNPTRFPGSRLVLSGVVFIDSNGNGVLDTNEEGYPGAHVLIRGYQNGETSSGVEGEYLFGPTAVIDPGVYTIYVQRTISTQPLRRETLYFSGPIELRNNTVRDLPINPQLISTTPSGPTEPATSSPTNSPTVSPTMTVAAPPTVSPTITPTPLVLYDCVTRTDTQIVNGKQIQISWLDCQPVE